MPLAGGELALGVLRVDALLAAAQAGLARLSSSWRMMSYMTHLGDTELLRWQRSRTRRIGYHNVKCDSTVQSHLAPSRYPRSRQAAAAGVMLPAATAWLTASRWCLTSGCSRNRFRRPLSMSVHIQSTGLAPPLRLQLAAFGHHLAKSLDLSPEDVDACLLRGTQRDHAGPPVGRGGLQHRKRPCELVLGHLGRLRIDVGLVDDDDIRELDDSLLDRLQIVAGVGQLQAARKRPPCRRR